MIARLASPLQLDSSCHQASCYYDETIFRQETADQLGLILPSTLASAVPKRKAEFLAGRYCARAALEQLDGSVAAPIGIGANRVPLWPPGFVGSITHTHGYASAVVARRNKIRAVGLDSETWIAPESVDNVGLQILTSRESHAEQMHLFESPRHYLTLVFSAKESLFKCLYPLVNRFFDFQAAIISLQSSEPTLSGQFRFELLEDLDAGFRAGYSGHGSYTISATCVHTAVILRAQPRN